jgi:hypothetical protein
MRTPDVPRLLTKEDAAQAGRMSLSLIARTVKRLSELPAPEQTFVIKVLRNVTEQALKLRGRGERRNFLRLAYRQLLNLASVMEELSPSNADPEATQRRRAAYRRAGLEERRQLTTLVVQLRKERNSYSQVCKRLDSAGVASPWPGQRWVEAYHGNPGRVKTYLCRAARAS